MRILDNCDPLWLQWARKLQALAQNGLTYTENGYDLDRYRQIRLIALEMMAKGSGSSLTRIEEIFEGEVGYQTPKVDTRGVVFREDRLLLVREKINGLWTLTGGWVDPNETPREAVEREVMEESGHEVRAEKMLALFDRSRQGYHPPHPYRVFKLFIRCRLIGGNAKDSLETEEASFLGEDEIPELSLARVTGPQITRMFEHLRHPEWPTDLD